MLKALGFKNVGPADALALTLRPRLNFLTGDNGLGKTFILDAAWWALTRTWAGALIRPHAAPAEGEISYSYSKTTPKPYKHSSSFDRLGEQWPLKPSRPAIPGLVVFAQVDGGFSVWDPARNYWTKGKPERLASYRFEPSAVWDGNDFCEGLVRDWASWQGSGGDAFEQLKQVLTALSPSETEPLVPGALRRRLAVDDPRVYPTLSMPYGQDVPVVHASAGMRRVIALAYVLVWAWQEHQAACELLGVKQAKEIIFLVDEVEAHLHPQWQRRIVPALLDVMQALTGTNDIPVQLIAATHSPLVLASAEPRFDSEQDSLWRLDLHQGQVTLEESPWVRRGDANKWLTSSIFELGEARSVEAERALNNARALLRADDVSDEDVATADAALRASLSELDGFWVRWSAWRDARGDHA
jgi:hypothetical protein